MRVVYIIYNILSTILGFGALGYVCVDIYLERKRAHASQIVRRPAPIRPPVVEKPVEIMPEPVAEIDEETADALISDALAMSAVSYERGARIGYRGIVNLGVIDGVFERDETVSVATLKEKGLLSPKVKRVKILADGVLHKPLTVKADAFSVQAVKMIELTGGKVVILRD